MSPDSKPLNFTVLGSAFIYTAVNSYLQTASFLRFEVHYIDILTIIGASIWLLGYVLNIHSDTILLNLRKPG